MRFRPLYTNPTKYYSVGTDEETGGYVLEVIVTGIAWIPYYFRLTKEEFMEFKSDPASIDDLAEGMAYDKGAKFYSDRIIKP